MQRQNSHKSEDRELITNIAMFLLNQDNMKKTLWSIKSVKFSKVTKILKVGIDTTDGKLGTTLTMLRKNARPLSEFLCEQGVTYCMPRIAFFVEKEDLVLARTLELISMVEQRI